MSVLVYLVDRLGAEPCFGVAFIPRRGGNCDDIYDAVKRVSQITLHRQRDGIVANIQALRPYVEDIDHVIRSTSSGCRT